MLAMYVHTHWGYNHPYAARTWTVEDWRGYLGALKALGYDAVMFWPLFDSMPPQPTASDRAFLARTARVIDMAHREFEMQFLLTVGPNVMGNEKASSYAYEQRPYFICERKINPGDPAAVEAMLDARRWQFEPLAAADGLAIIDSDPGGYIGSTNEEFVEVMGRQLAIFRQYNPKIELRYWVWVGWKNYNRFWAQAQQGRRGRRGATATDRPASICGDPRAGARPDLRAVVLTAGLARTPGGHATVGDGGQALLYPLRSDRGRADLSADQL